MGNRALFWGALFGTVPDLDILFNPLFDNAGQLWWHRGPSHSLLVMVLASLLLARPLAKLWRSVRISAAHAGCFVLLEWSTHVLIDCFNVYGTLVLWPFSPTRISFNNLFIIDPLFTAPMLLALIWLAFLRSSKQADQRRRINLWGLGLACLYVGMSVGAKSVASHRFEADLKRNHAPCLRRIEAPTAFNILLWRCVAEYPHEFRVGYRSLLDRSSAPIQWTAYPKGRDAVAGTPAKRELAILEQFTDGWWIARRHAKGAWIGDLRFGEQRSWNAERQIIDQRLSFAWDLMADRESQRLWPKPRRPVDTRAMLGRLAMRALGKRDEWERDARLEGITGQLPELLTTQP
ncbi:MAG TPA: metal-dependent hydrolase, partial [Luteolibacter sp.]|nr:metal-dependent hydrolase [Luteolibacter sp.]